jgi:SAM-dependent methyltransferase
MQAEQSTAAGHLAYYLRHGLNPVRYEMADLRRHLDRRESLYRTLGLPARLFRGARVLEAAAGSGQNSLYVAGLGPRELVLVEPNPTAQRDIRRLYATAGSTAVQPRLVESTFQDFQSDQLFDVVICENWLGRAPAERRLLRKLGALTDAGGLLVVTAVSPVGVLPNVLRKALTCRIDRPAAGFAERTARLVKAFGPHLETIPAMTRTPIDWVHDNVMNPAYFGVLLTVPMVLEDLGAEFDVLGASPRFAADWRWFKSLWGPHKEFNDHFLSQYWAGLHNFLDYRCEWGPRDAGRNRNLEGAAWGLIRAVSALEQAVYQGADPASGRLRVAAEALAAVEENVADLPGDVKPALTEVRELFCREHITADQVARIPLFRGLFGRETLYLSLEKRR